MLNEEPAQSQDLQMMGMLLPLGIEKGKDFKPDVATVARLNSAAAEAHAWLLAQIPTTESEEAKTSPNCPGLGNDASSRILLVSYPAIFARSSSQDLTRIRLGICLSLSAGTQAGIPAIRAPLTNNSASFSA